jgi:hypothetical protein
MIGSEKLFSMMSDVMVQIFQKILTGKFECISNLLNYLATNNKYKAAHEQFAIVFFRCIIQTDMMNFHVIYQSFVNI